MSGNVPRISQDTIDEVRDLLENRRRAEKEKEENIQKQRESALYQLAIINMDVALLMSDFLYWLENDQEYDLIDREESRVIQKPGDTINLVREYIKDLKRKARGDEE